MPQGKIPMVHELNRRKFLVTTGAGAVAALAPSGFARAQNNPAAANLLKGSGEVVVATWGGAYTDLNRRAYFEPFEKATGIKVTTTGIPDLAKMRLMAQTGKVEWDLIDAEGQMMRNAAKEGILEPINYDLMFSVASRADYKPSDLHQFGIPSIAFGYTLTWNTKTAKVSPRNWADFWDVKKFPGRRAVYAKPKPLLEAALLADGVAKKDLYPLNVDRGFAKLDEIKRNIDVWVDSTAQFDVLLQNGEVDYLLATQGRATQSRAKGFPVDYTFDNGFWEQSSWVIMKNAPNSQNAQKLLAWIAQPEGQALMGATWPCGVPNLKAYQLMKPEAVAEIPTAPDNLPKMVALDTDWWTANNDVVVRRWLQWYTNR
jgi:putative spermidine/putrescine transport system substrate-binding protein